MPVGAFRDMLHHIEQDIADMLVGEFIENLLSLTLLNDKTGIPD